MARIDEKHSSNGLLTVNGLVCERRSLEFPPVAEFRGDWGRRFLGRRSLVLLGPSGVGKTSLAILLSILLQLPIAPQVLTRPRRRTDPPNCTEHLQFRTVNRLNGRRRFAYFRRSLKGECHAYRKSALTRLVRTHGGSVLVFNSLSGWLLHAAVVECGISSPPAYVILSAPAEVILARLKKRDGRLTANKVAAVYRDLEYNRAICRVVGTQLHRLELNGAHSTASLARQVVGFVRSRAGASPGVLGGFLH